MRFQFFFVRGPNCSECGICTGLQRLAEEESTTVWIHLLRQTIELISRRRKTRRQLPRCALHRGNSVGSLFSSDPSIRPESVGVLCFATDQPRQYGRRRVQGGRGRRSRRRRPAASPGSRVDLGQLSQLDSHIRHVRHVHQLLLAQRLVHRP